MFIIRKEHVIECNSVSFMCFYYILSNNQSLWHRGINYIKLWLHRQYLFEE